MHYSQQSKLMFDDFYEMYYHLFSTIGLSVDSNQYLYDQDTGNVLKFKDKAIKATVIPIPIYAGKNDILFEPEKNYNLIVSILGYYIDKETALGDEDNIGFIAQYIEETPDKEKQRVVIKTKKGDLVTSYYRNIYLSYIEAIFILNELIVDLSNFDSDF